MGKLATKYNYLFKYLLVGVCIAILISSYWNACNKTIECLNKRQRKRKRKRKNLKKIERAGRVLRGATLSKRQKKHLKKKLKSAINNNNLQQLRKAIKKATQKGYTEKWLKKAKNHLKRLERQGANTVTTKSKVDLSPVLNDVAANSQVGNIAVNDKGGIFGNQIPSNMREMFLS